jgi:hypothetical protein
VKYPKPTLLGLEATGASWKKDTGEKLNNCLAIGGSLQLSLLKNNYSCSVSIF